MAEYTPQTIQELIKEIEEGRIVLPAMQRNFVWAEEKICHLFDSLMRDYPIGTFLFWDVNRERFGQYAFNTFIRNYDEEKGKMQRGEKATADFSNYKAVLDGQQRITSLYMGACGKYRTKMKNRRRDDPTAYYDRFLCLNIMHTPKNDDKYQFAFKKAEEIETKLINDNNEIECWVKVSTVINGYDADRMSIDATDDNGMDEADYLDALEKNIEDELFLENSKRTAARKNLKALSTALSQKQNINYYLAKNKNLSEVVEMFVRVNSGGEKLNASDLMLSIATGEQGNIDIHRAIEDALDLINASPQDVEKGFKVDKELLLRGSLMLTGSESLSLNNHANYTSTRINAIFKDHWEAIVNAFKASVAYIEYLGFRGNKLPSKNLLLPIAYYFYKNNYGENYKQSPTNSAFCDRVFIRQWLLRAMINSVFSDGTGNTLLQIRYVLDESSDIKHFPLEKLMDREIKRTLNIGEEQIEEILDLKYGDTRITPLFNEMLREAANPSVQEDHIWPRSLLMSKSKIRKAFPSATENDIIWFKEHCDCLSNLQLLGQIQNQDKSDTEFKLWLNQYFQDPNDRNLYLTTHFIPTNVSYDFKDFRQFFETRRTLLAEEIKKAFPSDFQELVNRYNLQSKLG